MRSLGKKEFDSLGKEFSLDDKKIWQLQQFISLLKSWNTRTNLVSKNDAPRLVSKHVYESLEIERNSLLSSPGRVLDLGAGAGFPGVPLAILHSEKSFTLLDSRRVKSLFLQEVADVCQLTNVKVVNERVENFHPSPSENFNFVLARAVASLDVLWGWSSPILCHGGQLIAVKGGDVQKEIDALSLVKRVHVKMFPFRGQDNPGFEEKRLIVVAAQ